MAEVLASALVGTIVTNLSNEALKQYALLTGLHTELQNLSDSFDLIKGVLYDAEVKQWNSGSEGEAVKTWLRQLKDAAYDADDVLDEFDIEVQRRQQQRGLKNHARSFFSLHHNSIAFRVEIASKLKSVRERLDAIYVKRPPGLNVGSPQGVLEWRLTTSLVDDSEICGRVGEKAKLINDLISSSEALSVHAVCGMGGLGKTTLAQMVYNAEKIKTHFPLRMWVCVSDNADIKSLTRAIIGSCSNNSDEKEELESLQQRPTDEKEELESLQQRLVKKLDGEKFLLVLDDVWEDFPDKWDRLKKAVRSGATGSVVLITTRIQQVAEKMRTVSICNMGRLSDDDSWSLFAIHAFRTGDSKQHETFKKFREGIVKKCGGVPLVLKVLGSMMQLKKEENEWSDVMESELWDLADEGEKILATLKLSYTHLPMNLKQCFSYCCIYPKDHVMEKNELIQLWMANEFIISGGGRKTLHERGQEIFRELVARSFFQNVEIDYMGNITCIMHDLLHDVAKSVMEHEIQLIQPGGQSLDGAKKYRHISVSSDDIDGMKVTSKIPSLRSFILMNKDDRESYDVKKVKWLFTQKYLRILRCQKLPRSLSKHLRYLDVSRSSIKRLPESICSLYKLQTLKLRFCYSLRWLPKGMKEMKSLVYLDIRGCNSLRGMPPGMGQLKGMRKLSKFIVGKKDGCGIGELKELNDLEGKLCIRGLCNVTSLAEAESANMMGKKMLTSLKLIAGSSKYFNVRDGNIIDMEVLSCLQPHQNLRKLVVNGYGSLELPNWMMYLHVHLPHLVEVKLMKFSQCQQLTMPLGRLEFLKDLELSEMPCLEHIGVEVYGAGEKAAFPSLEKLVLSGMRSLKEWAEIALPFPFPFPCLRELSILGCTLLTKVPIIPSVQALQIFFSTTSQVRVLIEGNFIGLKSLLVHHSDGLESLPELGPQQHDTVCCLEKLEIFNCEGLHSLPSTGLWCSSSLRLLYVKFCRDFITLSEDGLRHLTALESLYVSFCPKMTSLPESIQHLTALQTLTISNCKGLSCLPDGIRSLTTLATLEIRKCPDLERRCEKEKGEDWPKIAHIPSILINDKQIQSSTK